MARNPECKKEAQRRYYQKNREKIYEQQRLHRKKNPEKVAARHKRYYENNREKVAEYNRLRRSANPELLVRSAESTRRWRAKNLEKNREANLLSQRKRMSTPVGRLTHTLGQARRRAQLIGRPFLITIADLLPLPEHCPVFGIRLNYQGTKKRGFVDDSASIDRVDPAKGYVPGNVRIVCWRANRIKCDATIDELESVLRYMKEAGNGNNADPKL